jgi:hypothetical protein
MSETGQPTAPERSSLRRRGLLLEYLTIGWNIVEAVVAFFAGIAAGSIALIGFGLDSLIEVFAATVVVWELRGVAEDRERKALRLIAVSFFVLAAYVSVEAIRHLAVGSPGDPASADRSVRASLRGGRLTRRGRRPPGPPGSRAGVRSRDRGSVLHTDRAATLEGVLGRARGRGRRARGSFSIPRSSRSRGRPPRVRARCGRTVGPMEPTEPSALLCGALARRLSILVPVTDSTAGQSIHLLELNALLEDVAAKAQAVRPSSTEGLSDAEELGLLLFVSTFEVFLGIRALLGEQLAEEARMLSRTLLEDTARLIWLATSGDELDARALNFTYSSIEHERRLYRAALDNGYEWAESALADLDAELAAVKE